MLLVIPDLRPGADRVAFEILHDLEALGHLVERRTGVRPTFGMEPFWTITVPASNEMLAMTEEQKAVFLERHETRPLRADHWE